MLQLWVETRDDADILALLQAGDPRLRRIALFDAVVNNADRKGGHLLVRPDGLIQGVDHGVTFNLDPKLRTVIWNWRGTADRARTSCEVLAALRPLLAAGGTLAATLAEHLDPAEITTDAGAPRRAAALADLPPSAPGLAGRALALVLSRVVGGPRGAVIPWQYYRWR